MKESPSTKRAPKPSKPTSAPAASSSKAPAGQPASAISAKVSAEPIQKLTITPSQSEADHIDDMMAAFLARYKITRKLNRSNLARFALHELQANDATAQRFKDYLSANFG